MCRRTEERRPAGRWWSAAAAAGVLALSLPAAAVGQESGQQVFRTAMDRYEARLEGIDSVTVVQEVTMPMGMTRRQEFRVEKTTRDGRPLLVPADEDAGAHMMPAASMLSTLDSAMAGSVLRGRSEVDGHEVYVIAVPDLPSIDFGQGRGPLPGAQARSFRADSATFYVDTEEYLLRRGEVHGQMVMGGGQRSVQVDVHLSDYRETQGYLHPYRSVIRIDIEGMARQMQAMMQKMQEGGADSAQRAMVEQAVAAMMGNGMTVTAVVKEIRVNGGGSPDGG